MNYFLVLFFILNHLMYAKISSGESSSCGDIKVDCSSHQMTIGSDSPVSIDCGKNGATPSGIGKVGSLHSGEVVKDGVKVEGIGNMFETGKVFHLPPGGGEPTKSDNSKGCIHVNEKTLSKLKTCQGSSLSIAGSDGGKAGGIKVNIASKASSSSL